MKCLKVDHSSKAVEHKTVIEPIVWRVAMDGGGGDGGWPGKRGDIAISFGCFLFGCFHHLAFPITVLLLNFMKGGPRALSNEKEGPQAPPSTPGKGSHKGIHVCIRMH